MYYFRAIGCRWNIVYGCLGQKFVWKFKGKIVVFLNVAMCLGCKLFSRSINSLFNFSAKWQAWLTEQNCRTKLSSTFACFGDDTFSPFSGIYIQSSCWESCSVDSQWNSDDFCFFYFLDWTSESWEKWILVRLHSDDGDADHCRTTLSKTKILQTESNFQ